MCVCEWRRGERHRGKCEVLLYRGHGGGGGRVLGWRLKASSSSRGDKSLDRSKKGVSSSPPLILVNKFLYIAPTYSLICINFHWFLCITIFRWGAKTLGCWFKAVCKTFEDHGYAKIVWDTSDFFFFFLSFSLSLYFAINLLPLSKLLKMNEYQYVGLNIRW